MSNQDLVLKRRRWAVLIGDRYLRGPSGKIAWDYDRGRLEELAKEHGGQVVDAEALAHNPLAFTTGGK